jgi:cyclic lactone autoinducer peptide
VLAALHVALLAAALACSAACFLTFYEEVLPPQLRALIPPVSKGCLQPYMIFQVRQQH